jgi:3-oxoacyl-(acyl-carrier-protein) synthase
MACAPVEQAVTTAWLGPLRPWAIAAYEDQIATGVMIGSGIGGIGGIYDASVTLYEKGRALPSSRR